MIKSTINSTLIKECEIDQYKEYSVFKDLRDVSKQKYVALTVYD